MPSGGMGLRIESAIYPRYTLPPFYDSMIAKIIVHRPTREKAFTLLNRAVVEVVVEGLETNVELLEELAFHPDVQADRTHTKWLEEIFMPEWLDTLNEEMDEISNKEVTEEG